MVQHLGKVVKILCDQEVGQGGDHDDGVGNIGKAQSISKENEIGNFSEGNCLVLRV